METASSAYTATEKSAATLAREAHVRGQSDRYARTFCAQHAPHIGLAVRDWWAGRSTEHKACPVRVYSRADGRMHETTLGNLSVPSCRWTSPPTHPPH